MKADPLDQFMLAGIFDIDVRELLMRGVVIIPALTFHEFAHAWAAYRAGDETAYRMGRCSLNPLMHLDPIGTIMLFFGPIGWAKPVPVNPANLRRWPKDDIIVSLAGVVTNAISALVWTIILAVLILLEAKFSGKASEQTNRIVLVLQEIAGWGIFLNVALAIFNLLPIPPLDGSHVLGHMLKGQAALRYNELRRFGPILLIAVIIFGGPVLVELIERISLPLISLAVQLAELFL